MLISPFARQLQEWQPNVLTLYPGAVIYERFAKDLPTMNGLQTPLSRRLFDVLRDKVDGLVLDIE